MIRFTFKEIEKYLVEIDIKKLKDYKHLPIVRVFYRTSGYCMSDEVPKPRDMTWEVVDNKTTVPMDECEVRFYTFKAFTEAEKEYLDRVYRPEDGENEQ